MMRSQAHAAAMSTAARWRTSLQGVLLCLCLITGGCSSEVNTQEELYDGDHVLRVEVPSEEAWHKLQEVMSQEIPEQDIDVWREPTHGRPSADVYVRARHVSHVQDALLGGALKWTAMIDDVSRLIGRERWGQDRARRSATRGQAQAVVGSFARHHAIEAWLKKMAATYRDVTTLYSIGRSHEGRPMYVLQVGLGSGDQRSVWVDGGLHAREWVAPASVIYLIHKLLRNYRTDAEIHRYVHELSWYFLVVANPDGYEYTFTQYRFWRKNRRPMAFNCTGVDLNRNFGYMWGGADASPNPCNVVYRGPTPESEPEVQNIIRFLMPRRREFVLYMSLHSYGQKLLGRWAYTNETLPENHLQLDAVAQRSVRAMTRQHQRNYETGTAASLMYPYSGGSADWARASAGVRYSYVTELRDEGVYGFLLPVEEIVPTGQEIWAGIRVFLRYITNNPALHHPSEPTNTSLPQPAATTTFDLQPPAVFSTTGATPTAKGTLSTQGALGIRTASARPRPAPRVTQGSRARSVQSPPLTTPSVNGLLVLPHSGTTANGGLPTITHPAIHIILVNCSIALFLSLTYK